MGAVAPSHGWPTWLWPLVRTWRRARRPPMVQQVGANDVVDLRHRVLRAGRPRSSAVWDGDDDPETRHWAVFWAGEIVGIASVLPRTEPTHPTYRWQLRGMAIDPSARGKGLGGLLLQRVERDVGEPLWCNARESARGFYERHGWKAPEEPFDIPRIGPHYRMFTQL